jgi:dTDP-4-amino-4,6-dideoxygalactose transaminase
MQIPFYKINYDNKEIIEATKVLNSGFLTEGKYVNEFEKSFSKKLRLKEKKSSVAVSNCTSALYLCLKALNVKKGDEVIIPAMTFVADSNVVEQIGAKPIFCDSVSANDWSINPEDIKKKISKKTKVIIAVHFAGYPCNLKEILKICKDNNIFLVEDSCHALFSKENNIFLGTKGILSVFSFYGNKNFTTGEGGMIVGNKKLILKIKKLKSHGIYKKKYFNGYFPIYDVKDFGFNFRLTELQAILGLSQLKKIDFLNKKRKYIISLYNKYINIFLLDNKIIVPYNKYFLQDYSFHIFPILIPRNIRRNKVIMYLKNKGIETSVHYTPITKFSIYKKQKIKLPVVDSFYKRVLTLPLYPKLTEKDIRYIVYNLSEILSD